MNPRSTPDAIELELKFGLREVTVSDVSQALSPELLPLHTRWLQNIYYDTQKSELHHMGVAIRTRTIDQDHEMTVKIRQPDEGGLSRRQEWNIPLLGPELDRDQLLALPLPDPVLSMIAQGALRPVFLNEFHRTDWSVRSGSSEIMVSLDQGVVERGALQSPVNELELEWIAGEVDTLIALGCQIADALPSFMAVISKAERGERLATGDSPVSDPSPTDVRGWLYRLSRMLDPLAGPNPKEAVKALCQCHDHNAEQRFAKGIGEGQLPAGLARWMVEKSFEGV